MTTQCQAFRMSRRIYAEAMLFCIIVCRYGCSEGVAETATGSTIKGRVRESITFPFSAEGNQSYSVDLLFNNTFKIVTWYPQPFIHVREKYKGRVSIGSDSIWLNKLSLSDSGLYQVKIEYTSGSFKPPEYTYFHLQVFEPVSKPDITAECLGSNVSLSCFSSRGTEVAYSWETLPPCVRWVPALCATSAFLVFGVLILLYKRKKHQQSKSETIQVEVDEPVMEEEPPFTVPSIDPVYVSRLC
ncbi:uncharacterized protein LOC118229253 isoform X2 [Anguilla anguilla]|uniref:uncharacterized protein LOC118229253 isoform X2 n=1 Tax=Anguilla anguilla TaxID=7936 RepID=UPI0015AFCE97|nr:uncharacterized protein LOC118229253 isoform X2 [Anguilla anguilla]